MRDAGSHSPPAPAVRWYRPFVVLAAAFLLALMLVAGFYLGQHAAYSGMGAEPASYREMQAELIEAQGLLHSRRAELEIQQTRHEVDRQALEMVRKELSAQKDTIAGLEEQLGFYRSFMDPGEVAGEGLILREVELVAGDEPRQFWYRIVVQQKARRHDLLKGGLRAAVSGELEGEEVEYSLKELSRDTEDDSLALRFRYFQLVEGEISLPEGFEPRNVTVTASTRTPQKLEVQEVFPWQVQERFTHVGK